jgi:hypothetical protein
VLGHKELQVELWLTHSLGLCLALACAGRCQAVAQLLQERMAALRLTCDGTCGTLWSGGQHTHRQARQVNQGMQSHKRPQLARCLLDHTWRHYVQQRSPSVYS